jgi:CheY-like chemotaxis protein
VVVDDEPSIRRLLELTLGAADFAVITCEGPQSALAKLREGLHPDVIISDVTMPRMTALSFARRCARCPNCAGSPFCF